MLVMHVQASAFCRTRLSTKPTVAFTTPIVATRSCLRSVKRLQCESAEFRDGDAQAMATKRRCLEFMEKEARAKAGVLVLSQNWGVGRHCTVGPFLQRYGTGK